jgi:hypothetical protein
VITAPSLPSLSSLQAVHAVKQTVVAEKTANRVQRAARKAAAASAEGPSRPRSEVRRSGRTSGQPAPNYNENGRLLELADGEGRGSRDRRLLKGARVCAHLCSHCQRQLLHAAYLLLMLYALRRRATVLPPPTPPPFPPAENTTEEIYSRAHLEALGSCTQEW